MKINNRLNMIQEYHFVKIDEIKRDLIRSGKEIGDFSIGDPDLPLNREIEQGLIEGIFKEKTNRYAPYQGIKELILEIIKYYKNKFDVVLDEDEVIVLIGSKEGISNLIPSLCSFNDTVLVPNIAYPVYNSASLLWGCKTYQYSISEKNGYLPALNSIPENVMRSSKLLFMNYPNNPTGAEASPEFFKSAIEFCKKYNVVLCNDNAYADIISSNKNPISLLQFDDKHSTIEFGSFSKTYNMTGFRIAYAVGNRDVIKSLLKIKSNLDSGQYIPIQYAAIRALNLEKGYVHTIRSIYEERRKIAKKILREKNIKYFDSNSTFYIWCQVPKNFTTDEFFEYLLKNYGIIITPGYVFGSLGHGFFRIALTCDKIEISKFLSLLKTF